MVVVYIFNVKTKNNFNYQLNVSFSHNHYVNNYVCENG